MTVIETHVQPADWDAALAITDGPQLVIGGPGSGKTEFLVRRAHHLLDQEGVIPDQILLLSFSRRTAADLRERFLRRIRRSLPSIRALTFHSLAMQVLHAHSEVDGRPAPTPLTGPEHVVLVAELLRDQDPAAWPRPFRELLGTPSFAAEVADFCLRAAERLVGPDDLVAAGRADWRGLPGFVERYRRALAERGRIDYGTLQAEAVRLLSDPAIRDAVAPTARYVLVDEYQDTTVAQSELLAALAAPSGNVTVAADPRQSIFSFRGAEVANVSRFLQRFPGNARAPARRLVLTTSFRVPARIFDAARRVVAEESGPPMVPAAGDGSVEAYRFDQRSQEADWISAEVQRLHLRDRIPYHRIAVLLRSRNGPITELSSALDRRRIPHDRPGERLREHPAVRLVLDLVTAAVASDPARVAAIRRVLLGFLVGLPLPAVRALERRAGHGSSWTELLASAGTAPAQVGALLDDPTWATGTPASEGLWHLWDTLDGFARLVCRPERADDRAALASFSQTLDRLAERDPEATLADYLTLGGDGFEAEPLLDFRPHEGDEVALATLHQVKGREFDVVFIADAREGTIPDLRRRDSILGMRHLSPRHGGDDAAYAQFRVQEEMRLVYTAVSRARRRVVLTAADGGPDARSPGRIGSVITGLPPEATWSRPHVDPDPVTPQEAEAWLRRLERDPARPAALRLAALGALAGGGEWQPRPAVEFAGVLSRGPDTGVVGSDPILSPSQAESYAVCPRRFVLERALRIGGTASHHASLGALVHAVLERVEGEAADAGDDHGTGEAALAALDAAFDPTDFGGEPWATAWKRRAARILENLYRDWPGRGPAVGLEVPVERTIDGVTWRGRVDRLERREDGIWVIDYKTGASPPTVAEASRSLQLGFYMSALTDLDVAGAESWFPAVPSAAVTRRTFDPSKAATVDSRLRTVQRGILAEDWTPAPGAHCDRCPYRTLCPVRTEGKEAYSS